MRGVKIFLISGTPVPDLAISYRPHEEEREQGHDQGRRVDLVEMGRQRALLPAYLAALVEGDELGRALPVAESLLETLAAELQTYFQSHIREAQGPSGPFPQLRPQTRAIRRYYGHGAASPILIRGGDLLHSITTLALGDTSAEVGTRLRYARIVQDGGEVTDERGTRQVQAFPFVWISPTELEDLFEMIRIYYFGEDKVRG